MTVYPTYPGPRTLDQIRGWKTFKGMHPTMQERVSGVIEASGGKVGLGEGLRSSANQLRTFLDRHVVDPNGKYSYDGKRWTRVKGDPAVPPGSSMHEIGLAADLVGDMDWLADNVARFKLQTFENVNGEPYHVQPVELPRSRSEYEHNPTWGRYPFDGATAGTTGSSGQGGASTATPEMLTPAYRVSPGDSGPAAEIMIEALIAREQLPDTPESRDGRYDPADREIVEAFQRSAGLKVDGDVGPQTWGALLRVVKPGDEGPHVRVLQATLIARRLIRDTPGNRDGSYGDPTQEVIRRFQMAAGIGVDKEVGKVTWTSLIGEKKRIEVATRSGAADDVSLDDDDLDMMAYLDGRPAE